MLPLTLLFFVASTTAFMNLKDQDFTKPPISDDVLELTKKVTVLERYDTTTFADEVRVEQKKQQKVTKTNSTVNNPLLS
jgi:hypothetical protein